MSTQIKIYSSNTRPRYFIIEECGGSMSLDELIDLLQETDDYSDYMLHSDEVDIFYNNNIFHYYGASTIVNNVLFVPNDKKDVYDLNDMDDDPLMYLPDENLIEESIDLDSYYTSQPGYDSGDKIQNEAEFFHYAYCVEKGFWNYEAFEIKEKFNAKFLRPVFFEKSKMGVISHYLYDDKTSGESIEIYGELGSSGSRSSMDKSVNLYANTSEGLKWIDFEEIKSDISDKGLDLNDKKACRNYLIKKYNLKS